MYVEEQVRQGRRKDAHLISTQGYTSNTTRGWAVSHRKDVPLSRCEGAQPYREYAPSCEDVRPSRKDVQPSRREDAFFMRNEGGRLSRREDGHDDTLRKSDMSGEWGILLGCLGATFARFR